MVVVFEVWYSLIDLTETVIEYSVLVLKRSMMMVRDEEKSVESRVLMLAAA